MESLKSVVEGRNALSFKNHLKYRGNYAPDSLSPTKESYKQDEVVSFRDEPSSSLSFPLPAPTTEISNVKVKLSLSSQNLSSDADDDPGCTEFLNGTYSIDSTTHISSRLSNSNNINKMENGSDREIPEALKNNLSYLQQLGNFSAKNNLPSPNSECEREQLKTHLLEALKLVGALSLVVPWPTVAIVLEEERCL
ncbi:unnamed protein product [Trichobilharzia regenti]|nr:unnamed protein product [Trichobilharzia regenti]